MTPRCPLVLALLATRPRPAHEVARALDGDHSATRAALSRLEQAGLVRRRSLRGRQDYQLTGRGRRELRLQRELWTRVVARDIAACGRQLIARTV